MPCSSEIPAWSAPPTMQRLGKADYFTDVGMNVFQMFSVTASDDNFDATDLRTLLQNRTYKKIFIMLGINECGYPMSSLLSAYQGGHRHLEKAPAGCHHLPAEGLRRVLLCGRAPATSAPAPTGGQRRHRRSGRRQEKVHCLDASRLYCDDEGYMKEEYTSDGVHPYAKDAALFCPVAVPADQRRPVGLYRSPDVWYPV